MCSWFCSLLYALDSLLFSRRTQWQAWEQTEGMLEWNGAFTHIYFTCFSHFDFFFTFCSVIWFWEPGAWHQSNTGKEGVVAHFLYAFVWIFISPPHTYWSFLCVFFVGRRDYQEGTWHGGGRARYMELSLMALPGCLPGYHCYRRTGSRRQGHYII